MSAGVVAFLFLGLTVAAIGTALATVVYLLWTLLGGRGAARGRRLRVAWSCGLFAGAAALSAASVYFLVLMPGTMRVVRPDFKPPLELLTTTLAIVSPGALLTAVGLAMWWIWRGGVRRKRVFWSSLSCVLLFLAASGANYAITYSIQVPAFERYVMIESRPWRTQVGQAAPDLSVVGLDGSEVRLSDLRGKVVLLNFFATWCGPCLNELPHLQAMWNDLQDNDGFRMLVVSRGETPEAVADFRSRQGFSMPMAVDPDASGFQKFADEGIPRTYLISRDGVILNQSLGFSETDLYQRELATLRRMIDRELQVAR